MQASNNQAACSGSFVEPAIPSTSGSCCEADSITSNSLPSNKKPYWPDKRVIVVDLGTKMAWLGFSQERPPFIPNVRMPVEDDQITALLAGGVFLGEDFQRNIRLGPPFRNTNAQRTSVVDWLNDLIRNRLGACNMDDYGGNELEKEFCRIIYLFCSLPNHRNLVRGTITE